MTEQNGSRRAVALLHSDHDPAEFEALVLRYGLRVVYTVYTDAAAVLAGLIAAQNALEHDADVVVVPHLNALAADTPWWAVTEVADLITGVREYPFGSALSKAVRLR